MLKLRISRPRWSAIVLAAAAVGASGFDALADDLDARLAASRETASQLAQQLGGELRKELSAGGPESAIKVCKTVAPEIASKLSRETGARVARVSLRVRNPLLGTPDPWEQRALADFDLRVAAGEKPDAIEFGEIASEPDGRYWRYLKAIPVQPMCLACHGATESIPAPVKVQLSAEYPHDRALGYSAGQIRGAVTIKQRIGD